MEACWERDRFCSSSAAFNVKHLCGLCWPSLVISKQQIKENYPKITIIFRGGMSCQFLRPSLALKEKFSFATYLPCFATPPGLWRVWQVEHGGERWGSYALWLLLDLLWLWFDLTLDKTCSSWIKAQGSTWKNGNWKGLVNDVVVLV